MVNKPNHELNYVVVGYLSVMQSCCSNSSNDHFNQLHLAQGKIAPAVL